MRGFTVVLYVAVLLSLLSVALAACGPNGDAKGAICICKSGYRGSACDTTASSCLAAEATIYPGNDVADNFPKLNATEGATVFKGNYLYAAIVGDHVANRTYQELVFADLQSNYSDYEQCAFGVANSFWTMDFQCKDRFQLALPWTSHRACGFHVDTAATTNEYLFITNTLHLKYEDWVYIDMGVNENNETEMYKLERTVSIPYRMTVRFQRYINVTLLALNITSDVKFGAALTADQFNPVDGTLTLEITTIINYPNSFLGLQQFIHFHHPATVKTIDYQNSNAGPVLFKNVAGIQGVGLVPGDCYVHSGTCKQVWEVTLVIDELNGGNCTFDGDYRLDLPLYTCRSTTDYGDMDCTNVMSMVNFTLTTNNVCGSIDITPNVDGVLVPFKHGLSVDTDSGPALIKKEFKLGEYGSFFAKINSDGNAIKINFTDVRFRIQNESYTEADWVYLYKNKAHEDSASLVHLDLQHEKKYFTVYFHSSVFRVPPTKHVTYVFSAWVDILFLGNEGEQKKRSVEYTFESETMDTQAIVGIVSPRAIQPTNTPAKAVTDDASVNQTTFVASVVGAIAGTMLIVFVVVGVALRTRNQSGKRDAAASAAVVAANAAAQSIEVVSRV